MSGRTVTWSRAFYSSIWPPSIRIEGRFSYDAAHKPPEVKLYVVDLFENMQSQNASRPGAGNRVIFDRNMRECFGNTDAGWIPSGVELPPSMRLSDLQNVFVLLDGICPKLHYLYRRTLFERMFDLGPTETNGTRIMGYGAGQVFDHYFLELEQSGSIPHRHYGKTSAA